MARCPQGMIIFGQAEFVAIGVACDRALEVGEAKTGASGRIGQMRAFIPAADASIPKELCHLSTEFQASTVLRGGNAQAAEPASEWLIGANRKRLRILDDRVGIGRRKGMP